MYQESIGHGTILNFKRKNSSSDHQEDCSVKPGNLPWTISREKNILTNQRPGGNLQSKVAGLKVYGHGSILHIWEEYQPSHITSWAPEFIPSFQWGSV
jgi:hypothetical protein